MRQWFTRTQIMCKAHLLGEHVEHHMFCGQMKRKRAISGYVNSNCVQPKHIKTRHDELVKEMIRRGYNHNSPVNKNPDISYLPQSIQDAKVDVMASTLDLISRCPICRSRAIKFYNKIKNRKLGVSNEKTFLSS